MSSSGLKLTQTKKQAAELLGIGLTGLNELIQSGKLRTVPLGGRVLIPTEALEALAREGDGQPIRRGWNAAIAGMASAKARKAVRAAIAARKAAREASAPASPPQDASQDA